MNDPALMAEPEEERTRRELSEWQREESLAHKSKRRKVLLLSFLKRMPSWPLFQALDAGFRSKHWMLVFLLPKSNDGRVRECLPGLPRT